MLSPYTTTDARTYTDQYDTDLARFQRAQRDGIHDIPTQVQTKAASMIHMALPNDTVKLPVGRPSQVPC
jgi:hypothetical protein